MKTVSNDLALRLAIGTDVVSLLEKIGNDIYDKWYRSIVEGWYNMYEPSFYDRQYAILKSLIKTEVKIVGSVYSIEVYIDEAIMSSYHHESNKFDGKKVADVIEKTGMMISSRGNSINREASHAMESTLMFLASNLDKYIQMELGATKKV